MTKKQLIKWVEGKRADALVRIEQRYQEALADHTAALHIELGISELTASIKPLLAEADDLLMAWREKWKERVSSTCYWNSLHNRLYNYTKDDNALYKSFCAEEFTDTTEERRRLDQTQKATERDTNSNYANVLRNLQVLKDAKLGLEYLKKLGFDVSEVVAMDEKPVFTALAVPIDTRFLFLKKEGSECS